MHLLGRTERVGGRRGHEIRVSVGGRDWQGRCVQGISGITRPSFLGQAKAVPVTSLPSSNVPFANGSAVRAAGRVGEPQDSRTLDRDGDGVACE
ncbi:excalibur calcium-binding domain-containing protein [Deinococcus yavapaiensis]|uniref:excalibur calcium-binding domain-containing protein n=1 Tax=Deinococcus yavapaiensis TaxID=309889 RepID=UPI000DA1B92D|nr:excalibur calcium-binding domain-containing protein [Deinococcus yavapaiensis]